MLMDKKHTRSPVEPATTYPHEFWENYTLFLVKQGVSQRYVTWYVLRTKQYIAYFPDDHIRTHKPQQVEKFLTKVGREVNLKAWQLGQVVDAIRILFCLALKKRKWYSSKTTRCAPSKPIVVGLPAFFTSINPMMCMIWEVKKSNNTSNTLCLNAMYRFLPKSRH